MDNLLTNILTIDVEEWFVDTDPAYWDSQESRIVSSTHKVLEMLAKADVRATFFILGYVAHQHPELVETIRSENHEIATHGYWHKSVARQSPAEFTEDLSQSINTLEEITREKVIGYRAPMFTIGKKTSWAIDILKEKGLRYDSSIFPVRTHLYGVPDAPRFPYRICSSDITRDFPESDFWEVSPSSYHLPVIGRNLPVAGGFYLRFFPYWFIRHALKKINSCGHPAVCYLHPWELDPEQPRVSSISWHHYYGLSKTERNFSKLLKDFQFTTVRESLSL